ncbi:MAG TPA: DUF3160 domain-containing protein [Polyangia bacterium]|jgi:hypothetical protein|nr:DUF3160 domain-containing protein [Polyangia bacterium]
MTHSKVAVASLVIISCTLAACSGGGGAAPGPGSTGGGGGSSVSIGDAGAPVTLALSAAQTAAIQSAQDQIAATKSLSAAALATERAVPFAAKLPYDPMAATNLSLLQASHVKLDDDELAMMAKNGFVISDRKKYPGFVYGYSAIYADDLPVYVSADSIMHAVHRSYDQILKTAESERLVPELGTLLDSMRARLAARTDGFSATAQMDADLYLAVAKALLTQTAPQVVAGGDGGQAAQLVNGANAAAGVSDVVLFGLPTHYDFSQFKPRGHYVGTPALEQYFRAMIWLGRTELPLIHVDENTGDARFVRRQLDLAVALRMLMDVPSLDRWKLIDSVLRAFVGEPDSMAPPQIDQLLADLQVSGLADLGALSDQTIAQQIVTGGYGKQAINSQVIMNGTNGTLPLSASWLFLGQRFVVDSYVFSNVTYDRVQHPPAPLRMLPNPLDAAYAALANDQAIALLGDDLTKHAYAPDLEAMRLLVGQYDDTFWHANLYNEWLGALRALSPTTEIGDATSGLPSIARSEAWGRRLLNTQLASWAELRRDTILYAKQSYSSGPACDFPDAYVDPYPTFFAALESFAQQGAALADTLVAGSTSAAAAGVKTYFQHLADVSAILREMAEHQRTGTPHTADDLAFINQIVKVQQVCGGAFAQGWYPGLFYNVNSTEFAPTIADVHTAPTDENGNPTGNVLHVATGYPRLMVVTVDTCTGPRAYAGVASAYHEKLTENFQRLNDEDWSAELMKGPADDVVWMKDLVVH